MIRVFAFFCGRRGSYACRWSFSKALLKPKSCGIKHTNVALSAATTSCNQGTYVADMVGVHIGQIVCAFAKSDTTIMVTNHGRKKSKAEFYARVAALVQALQHDLFLHSGDRVAIAALNSEWYLEWLLAVPCAGGIIAPLNYRWSIEEATAAMQLIEPTILVVDQHCFHWCDALNNVKIVMIGENVPETPIKSCISTIHAETLIRSNKSATEINLLWGPDATALICFTSGTTGHPKGACLGHTALMVQSFAKITTLGYSCNDVYLHTAPLCHVGGISSALAMLMVGACQIMHSKFEAGAVADAIDRYAVSAMIMIPTMLQDITTHLKLQSKRDLHFESMKTLLNGAGSLSNDLLKASVLMFPNARIVSAYGMTEASSSITFLLLNEPQQQQQQQQQQSGLGNCVGTPAAHVEIQIRNNSTKSSEGNVLTRGPHVMEGYWRQVEETICVLTEDGWLDTGDIGRIDTDGNLWLLGREKDVIKTGGENVYASEVEYILNMHPSVSTAVVVGVHHERLNEVVATAVLLKEGRAWADDQAHLLQMHCKNFGLSSYKIPKLFIQQHGPFDRTSTGKIRKDKVIEHVNDPMAFVKSLSSLTKHIDLYIESIT